MYVLMEALKLLRVVEAKLNPEEFNTVKLPYHRHGGYVAAFTRS